MTPSECYRQKQHVLGLNKDPAQTAALATLDTLYTNLQTPPSTTHKLWQYLTRQTPPTTKGIYLWGGVGRGKTLLMDTFCECLPANIRLRVHFHRFMQQIHQQLRDTQHTQNPLQKIAMRMATTTRVLCLDEFHVNNITDAMLLAGLLRSIFNQNICLITTSNLHPDELYQDGLQRQRFLPAIEIIKTHTQLINIDTPIDYRLRTLQKNTLYHFPLTPQIEQKLQNLFTEISAGQRAQPDTLQIHNRAIPVKGLADGIVWFEFATLCNSPRSQTDYLEIACEYHTLILSEIPSMNDDNLNAATRFLTLIDILYDHRVKLINSACTTLDQLYIGSRLQFEYQRVTSRLIEMQSASYLEKPHQP